MAKLNSIFSTHKLTGARVHVQLEDIDANPSDQRVPEKEYGSTSIIPGSKGAVTVFTEIDEPKFREWYRSILSR